MARPNQHHHTVPDGYLRGFADSSRRGFRTNVLDLNTGEWRFQKPTKICKRRGFYSIDIEGLDENAIETGVLGKMEDDAIPIIRRLDRNVSILRSPAPSRRTSATRLSVEPSPDERELLVSFVAMMYLRSDLTRSMLDRGADVFLREFARRANSDKETFEKKKEEALREGVDLGNLSHSKLQEIIDSNEFRFGFDQTYIVGMMVMTWWDLYLMLRERTMSILIAGGHSGLLVSSNAPVGVYIEGDPRSPELYTTDLRDPRFGICMPLSPRILLRLDSRSAPETRGMTENEVALVNTAVTVPQRDLVVSNTKEFRWFDGERIRVAADLPSWAQRLNRDTANFENERNQRSAIFRVGDLFPGD